MAKLAAALTEQQQNDMASCLVGEREEDGVGIVER